MTRLIDADELRKTMYHEAFETDTDMQRWDTGCWIRYKMFENALENAPTIKVEPVRHGKWITVKEMLPEANGRYLVTRGLMVAGALWNRVYIANYSDLMGLKSEKIWWQGNVGKSDFKRLDDVVSWMPLPEPWKGEANEVN